MIFICQQRNVFIHMWSDYGFLWKRTVFRTWKTLKTILKTKEGEDYVCKKQTET